MNAHKEINIQIQVNQEQKYINFKKSYFTLSKAPKKCNFDALGGITIIINSITHHQYLERQKLKREKHHLL